MERQKKREQIEAIDDEVDVLHPLLNDLLRNLDNIRYVEYTHGPNEMGADFVLERFDPTTQETYHIGVIAKTEKILQNYAEVERQIDECALKRFLRQGKDEVRLPEVWVVTTKSFSQNAKKKIADKYPARRIVFFDADWLVSRIDESLPYYWNHLPNATGSYLATLSRTIAALDAQTLLLQSPGANTPFIELDVQEAEAEQYRKNSFHPRKPRLVNFARVVLKNKVTLLEADMGFGKSRLSRHVVAELTHPDVLKDTRVIPLFQPFIVFSTHPYTSLQERLVAIVGQACYNEAMAGGYSFLIVLDGIDESNGGSEQSRNVISALLKDVMAVDYVQLLLTSRPYKLLEKIPDLERVATRYNIRPLSVGKLIKFLEDVLEKANLPKKLFHDLAKSDLFKQLPQNPMAAALLSNLLTQNKEDLPANLTELYSKSMDFMLGRWDEKKAGLTTEKLFKACERLARQIGRYMIDNQLIFISTTEAREMIADFLRQREIGVTKDEVWDYLINRSHLFGTLEDSGTIFFRHRSFAEYLYARDAYERRDLTIDSKAFSPYWVNVYFFYIGLLTECPQLLRELVKIETKDEGSRWIRFLQMSNYLLAGYQSPYAVVEESLTALFTEIARLYIDVKLGKSGTNLRQMSEMKVLWLFTMLVKHSCGYEFFHRALPLVMAEMDDDSSLDSETRIYALFFAASALADLGDVCGYRFLLGKHNTNVLPLPLALGLHCETQFAGKDFSNDPEIKKHAKRLRQMLSPAESNKVALQHKLESLFEKPLKTATPSKALPKEHLRK